MVGEIEANSGSSLWAPGIGQGRGVASSGGGGAAVWDDAPYSEAEERSQGIQLLEYWRVIYKHKWVVAVVVAVALALGLVITLLTPRMYSAGTTIEIDRETTNVAGVGDVTPDSNMFEDGMAFYQTQVGLLKSWSLANRVAQSMALVSDPTFLRATHTEKPPSATDAAPPWVIGFLQGGLEVTPVKDSRLVQISFESPNPGLSARVANAFADNFIQSNLERKFQASTYARNFLQSRIAEYKAKLEDSDRQLVAYATQHQIIDVAGGTVGDGGGGSGGGANQSGDSSAGASRPPMPLQLAELASLDSALMAAKTNQVMAEEKYKATLASHGLEAPDILGDPAIEVLRGTRATLAAQYENQLKIYKPDYPDMIQLKAQIAEIDKELLSAADTDRKSLKTVYDSANQTVNGMQSKVDALKAAVLNLNNQEIEYSILQREVDTNQTLYYGLLQRYKEIGIAGGATTNNVSIVDRARPSNVPSQPRPVQNMAFAGITGLAGGIALAFLLETLDQAVRKPADVETKLGLPVLGSVPLLEKGVQPMEALADLRSPMSEAYHSIRSNLAFTTKDGAPRVLAITSSRPEEGKSTSAFALAQGFARGGMRVLLADMDLRNPSIHKLIGSDNRVGVSNLLTGAVRLQGATQNSDWPNLFLIPSGPLPPSPAELLNGPRLLAFMKEASEHFDIVVLDCPPVMGLADAPLIASVATGTLLTIEAGHTSRAQARGAIRRLRLMDTHLVGSILTKFDARKMAYGYGYAYAYDYEYNYQYGQKQGDVTSKAAPPIAAPAKPAAPPTLDVE